MANEPVTIIIDGEPVAKGRPRITQGRAVTPAKTRAYEAHVQMTARAGMRGKPPISGALRANIVIKVPIPASWPKRAKAEAEEGVMRPTSKPDIDNFQKSVLDGMNGIVFDDDSQIVEVTARKFYAQDPGVIVTIAPI